MQCHHILLLALFCVAPAWGQQDAELERIKGLRVVLVTEKSLSLEALLDVAGMKRVTMTPAEYEKRDGVEADLVIFDGHQPGKPLAKGVAGLYLGAVPAQSKLKAARDADGSPVRLENLAFTDADRKHPVIELIMEFDTLEKVKIERSLRLEVPEGWARVAGTERSALIVARRAEDVRAVVVAFRPEAESNWFVKPNYVVFLMSAIEWLTEPPPERK